ncbi:MAG: hypothetical protein WEB60_07330 [Terrimicrobiaceae bacterium]
MGVFAENRLAMAVLGWDAAGVIPYAELEAFFLALSLRRRLGE